jgi:hypothetical protein
VGIRNIDILQRGSNSKTGGSSMRLSKRSLTLRAAAQLQKKSTMHGWCSVGGAVLLLAASQLV